MTSQRYLLWAAINFNQGLSNFKGKAIFDILVRGGAEYNMPESKVRFNYVYI